MFGASIPNFTTVLIATHSDAAGNSYAEAIQKTITDPDRVHRLELPTGTDLNDLKQNGGLDRFLVVVNTALQS